MQSSGKNNFTPKRKSAFTLVELVVVITILAILGTIGFLSVGGYSSRARDSSRVADVSQLSKSLDVSIISAGSYPTPDNYFTVTYSGSAVWYQGTASNGVMQKLHTSISGGGLDAKPTDPLKGTDYVYSSLAFGKAYQIKTEYEGDLTAMSSIVSTAYAAAGAPTIALIRGNYGGIVAKTFTGSAQSGTTYVLAIPSIVTGSGIAAGTSVEISSNSLTGTLLFNGKNLTGASSFNPNVVVFSGSNLPKDDTTGQITAMMTSLKNTYASSDIASTSQLQSLIATATGSLGTLWTNVITGQLGGTAVSNGGVTVVDATPLYAFTTFTFTPCGITGRLGPTLANCTSTYGTAWSTNPSYYSMPTQGIQSWAVPATGTYRIETYGAAGGNATGNNGGKGAKMQGEFSLSVGDNLLILVGQKGADFQSSGGGGGTFVAKGTSYTTATALIISGGGGGARSASNVGPGGNGLITDAAGNGAYFGGSGGNGGKRISTSGAGGYAWGGFLTDWLLSGGTGSSGYAFRNGGAGGLRQDNGAENCGDGGFGGGGGGMHNNNQGSGGGGGWSGGGAGHDSDTADTNRYTTGVGWGGGGGSYNIGTNPVNSAGFNSGAGYVVITKL